MKINFEKEEIFNDGKYLHEILASAYPEYDWIPWSFVSLNPNYWNKKDNCKKFLDWFAAKKGIHSENEWYSISKTEIANYGGQKLLEIYGGLLGDTLEAIYQKKYHKWKFSPLMRNYWQNVQHQVG